MHVFQQSYQHPRNSWSSSCFLFFVPLILSSIWPTGHLINFFAGWGHYKIMRPFYILTFGREILIWGLAGVDGLKRLSGAGVWLGFRFGLSILISASQMLKKKSSFDSWTSSEQHLFSTLFSEVTYVARPLVIFLAKDATIERRTMTFKGKQSWTTTSPPNHNLNM